ncbi:MAG: cellulase family glycosylhydrolase [Clostridiales bacterium]|nr:cellulase family glycosylhydrolase [Clostridiales bacterium]
MKKAIFTGTASVLAAGLLTIGIINLSGGSEAAEASVKEDFTEDALPLSCETSSASSSALNVPVSVKTNSKWQENSSYCYSYEITADNNSSKTISDWQMKLTFSGSTEIMQLWNGSYNLEGNALKISPANYNKNLTAGSSLSVGFNCKSSAQTEIISVKLYEKGKIIGEYTKNNSYTAETETEAVTENAPKASGGEYGGDTPLEKYGKLSVSGKNLVDSSGEPVVLQGVSTHGLAWYPQYIDKEGFRWLRDYMNTDVVRLAVYSSENEGYSRELYTKVDEGVAYASELGMYVMIDWHILEQGNPNTNKGEAAEFFTYMAEKYRDCDNVIYEICNEPNGDVQWERDIKPYAAEIIEIIRSYDEDGIIIVGTPTWSQDVDTAALSPIENQTNIMYALHFYAGTHGQALRDKLSYALSLNLPVFVTEFGISEASGGGSINTDEGDLWINFLRENNISYVCWNLSNKAEACAILNPDCNKTSAWEQADLSESGKWLFNTYNTYK